MDWDDFVPESCGDVVWGVRDVDSGSESSVIGSVTSGVVAPGLGASLPQALSSPARASASSGRAAVRGNRQARYGREGFGRIIGCRFHAWGSVRRRI